MGVARIPPHVAEMCLHCLYSSPPQPTFSLFKAKRALCEHVGEHLCYLKCSPFPALPRHQAIGRGSRDHLLEIRVPQKGQVHFPVEADSTAETPRPLQGTDVPGRVYHSSPQVCVGNTLVEVGTEPTLSQRPQDKLPGGEEGQGQLQSLQAYLGCGKRM